MAEQTHEHFSATKGPDMGSNRAFGMVFAVVFALLAIWNAYQANMDWALPFAAVAVAFFIVALTAPKALKPLNVIWFKFGLLLHKIISPLVLGLLFFVAVTPTGIIMRLRGKDLLLLKLDPDAESYWIKRDPPGPEPKSMADQF